MKSLIKTIAKAVRYLFPKPEYVRLDISGLSDDAAVHLIKTWLDENHGDLLLVTDHTAFVRRWLAAPAGGAEGAGK